MVVEGPGFLDSQPEHHHEAEAVDGTVARVGVPLEIGEGCLLILEARANVQAAYDLDVAQRASASRIERDVHPREAA